MFFQTPLYKADNNLFSTFVYSLVYIPFPGPPALNDPPPPSIIFKTQIAIKSGSCSEHPSKPIITCERTGRPAEANCGISHSS